MMYNFPVITHIDDVKPYLIGYPEFSISEKDNFDVINYHISNLNTFGSTDTPTYEDTIRRECRGIKFYKNGLIAARPFHKFFNVNERPETQSNLIDLKQKHIVMVKMDGSMIHPIRVGDHIRWCTKMGITDIAMQVEEFIALEEKMGGGSEYTNFANYCIVNNMTPIFEWCSRQQKIVLDYEHDELILLAIRHNDTGNYASRYVLMEAVFNFKLYHVAISNSTRTIHDIIAETRAESGNEGYVLQFDSGHMLKIKTDWYVALHKSKDRIRFEKDVISLILENQLDDLLPILDENDLKRILAYQSKFWKSVDQYFVNLYLIGFHTIKKFPTKKDFALSDFSKKLDPLTKSIIFKYYNEQLENDWQYKITIDYIKKHLSSSSKVEEIRYIIGNYWVDN